VAQRETGTHSNRGRIKRVREISMLRNRLVAIAVVVVLIGAAADAATAGGPCYHGRGYSGGYGGGGYGASYYRGPAYRGGGYGYGYGGPVVVRRPYFGAPVYPAPYPTYPRYGGRGGVTVSFGF